MIDLTLYTEIVAGITTSVFSVELTKGSIQTDLKTSGRSQIASGPVTVSASEIFARSSNKSRVRKFLLFGDDLPRDLDQDYMIDLGDGVQRSISSSIENSAAGNASITVQEGRQS